MPIISTLVAVELEDHDFNLNNIPLAMAAVISLMLTFLLLYVVYIIPKPQHFSHNFLGVYMTTALVNVFLFIGAMGVLVISLNLNIHLPISGSLIVILFATGILMDVFLMLKSKTLLVKSLLYTSISLVIVTPAYFLMMTSD